MHHHLWPGVFTEHPGTALMFHPPCSIPTFWLFPCRRCLRGYAYYELSVVVKVSECVQLARLSSSDAVEERRVSIACVHATAWHWEPDSSISERPFDCQKTTGWKAGLRKSLFSNANINIHRRSPFVCFLHINLWVNLLKVRILT